MLPIVICSKSTWLPAVRREHAIARSAAADGHEVVFVERAIDLRSLMARESRRTWVRDVRARAVFVAPNIRVWPQSTLVPGHRSRAAQWSDAARLRISLRRIGGIERSVVIATQPWDWPAVAGVPAARRVFDCADDWRMLLPNRYVALDALCRRIGREADAVTLASRELVPVFAGEQASIVKNGTDPDLLRKVVQPPPSELRMVYAGTLSERVDMPFLVKVLHLLPEWSVELYGQCQYRGHGSAPAPELRSALELCGDRLGWHGPIERRELATALDRGRVLIAPHRASYTRGQDSMKLYDYAARERPIVCTPGALGSREHIAEAGVVEAATPAEFAAAVRSTAGAGIHAADAQRGWAARNSWDSRWPTWRLAALDGAP